MTSRSHKKPRTTAWRVRRTTISLGLAALLLASIDAPTARAQAWRPAHVVRTADFTPGVDGSKVVQAGAQSAAPSDPGLVWGAPTTTTVATPVVKPETPRELQLAAFAEPIDLVAYTTAMGSSPAQAMSIPDPTATPSMGTPNTSRVAMNQSGYTSAQQGNVTGARFRDVQCPDSAHRSPLSEISLDIAPSDGELPKYCGLDRTQYIERDWRSTTLTWTAPSLCHKPAYFEDVKLERYGHTCGPLKQPVMSAARFFLTVPILPYKMGLYPPNECMYSLGYYRPGSCAPYMLDPLPLSVRGGLMQAGAVVGAAAIIP